MDVSERKKRLPHGAVRGVARKLALPPSVVSDVLNERWTPRTLDGAQTVRRVRVALAREARVKVAEMFPVDARAA